MRISTHRGYVLLLTILVTGVVASVVVSSLLLLGTASNRASFSVQQSSQSLSFSQGCAEDALFQLMVSPSYSGNETLSFPEGTCDILPVGGTGNSNRFICIQARTGDTVRRLEIIVQNIQDPVTHTMKIQSMQEVASFGICS